MGIFSVRTFNFITIFLCEPSLSAGRDQAQAYLDGLDLPGDGDGPDELEENDVVGQGVVGPERPGRTPHTS